MKSKKYRRLNSLYLNVLLTVVALIAAVVPLYLSEQLMERMVAEEHLRIETWAKAVEGLASEDVLEPYNVMLHIIESNKTIPVILATERDSIVSVKNISIPDKYQATGSREYLARMLKNFKKGYPPIVINVSLSGGKQYLYYSASSTLHKLLLFPYLQTAIFALYLLILFVAIRAIRRSEQNRIWEGLSRETAHQLGTPISSLSAWVELIELNPAMVADGGTTQEMRKDISRLAQIADRFQKVGSKPSLHLVDVERLLLSSLDYLQKRFSSKVSVRFRSSCSTSPMVLLSEPLFEWVVENVVKNAVDALPLGEGIIEVHCFVRRKKCCIDITDNGRGIPKRNRKRIFSPGFTTKKRGWGLGLSLAKRIVEQIMKGRIFVKESEINVGTTIRIILPLC